jgi:hypothetical protein
LAFARVSLRPEVASALTGASRLEQIFANAAASGVDLGVALLAAIDTALGGVPIRDQRLAIYATGASSTARYAGRGRSSAPNSG